MPRRHNMPQSPRLQDGQELNVDSTVSRRVVYDAPSLRLFVEFNTGRRCFCYDGVDSNAFEELKNDPSIDSILTGLRHRFQSSRVPEIPQGPIRYIPDYSSEWLAMLSRVLSQPASVEIDVAYLYQLRAALDAESPERQYRPPAITPPLRATDEPRETAPRRRAQRRNRGGGDSTSRSPSMQLRYIVFEISCGIVDAKRKRAFQMNRSRLDEPLQHYFLLAQSWEDAYLYLNALLQGVDQWHAIYLERSLNIEEGTARSTDPLADFHDFDQLENLLDRASIVQDATEADRQRALHYLDRKLQQVEERLDPLLVERDAVKEKIGEYKWTHNPNPKMTYAEKRKAWENERDAIKKAISIIAALTVHDLL